MLLITGLGINWLYFMDVCDYMKTGDLHSNSKDSLHFYYEIMLLR